MPPRTTLSSLLTSFLRPSLTLKPLSKTPLSKTNDPKTQTSLFSTTPQKSADASQRQKVDARITLLRYHLLHPRTPRPLRLSRLRYLRHWTIHRAWTLFRRQRREREEEFLQRQHQAMHAANEALRLLDPPGTKDAGRLYRIAMEKKGVFGKGGVPIEYARAQVERPGKEAWNHGWTR